MNTPPTTPLFAFTPAPASADAMSAGVHAALPKPHAQKAPRVELPAHWMLPPDEPRAVHPSVFEFDANVFDL